jgi:hypothetical protein
MTESHMHRLYKPPKPKQVLNNQILNVSNSRTSMYQRNAVTTVTMRELLKMPSVHADGITTPETPIHVS